MTLLPIVEREMRAASRRRVTYWSRSIAALSVLAVGTLIFWDTADAGGPPQMIGQMMFGVFCVVSMLFAGVSGLMFTSDCLSEEKREGTIGLLFLTDLHGFDIVLGKLAATSLQSVYGFLATAPIVAVPILFGGITGSLYGWALLLIAVTVFFSLSVGLFASSLGRLYRNTVGGTFLIILITAVVPPMIYAAVSISIGKPASLAIMWPSPAFALVTLLENKLSSFSTIPMSEFWKSLATIFGMGAFFMISACLILPLVWRDGAAAAPKMPRTEKALRRRHRRRAIGATIRARLLSANPFYWLAVRDQIVGWQGGIVLGLIAAAWVFLLIQYLRATRGGQEEIFGFLYFLTLVLPIVLKFIGATASTMRLSDDRRSGALELLLVTPLSPEQIFKGQWRAFYRRFAPSLYYVLVMFSTEMLCVGRGYVPGIPGDSVKTLLIILSCSLILLWLDFYAMAWVGMWSATHCAKQNRAASIVVGKVLLFPWLVLLIGSIIVGSNNIPETTAEHLYYFWLGSCGVYDLWLVWRAKRRLRRDFRRAAAGTLSDDRRKWFQLRLKPAAA